MHKCLQLRRHSLQSKGIYSFFGAIAKLQNMAISFIMCVHLSILKKHNMAPIERIFIKFIILVFFKTLSKIFNFL